MFIKTWSRLSAVDRFKWGQKGASLVHSGIMASVGLSIVLQGSWQINRLMDQRDDRVAAFIGLGVSNFEIRDAEGGTDLLIKSPYLGQALAKCLGNCPATLMRGHGAASVGESLQRAVGRAIYLEMSARMQLDARLGGSTYAHLDELAAIPTDNFLFDRLGAAACQS